ncbi:aminoglycoside phosphotransferase family protein [Streptomyces sp. NBC_00212]|uniref:phosphotransferase family protein n=1 Tax=Streptomyces sp. NBC_00212 TaxID=2975684 RepID=UPI002F90961C
MSKEAGEGHGSVLGGRDHVRRGHEQGIDVVVKRARGDVDERRGLFLEAALQSAAAGCYLTERSEAAVPVIPPLACTAERLTVEFHASVAPLDQLFSTPKALNRAAGVTGREIASLHGQEISGPGWAWLPAAAGEHPPLEPIPLTLLGELSEGTVELAAEIHRQEFSRILTDALAEESGRRVFVHGDFKFDNILASADGRAVRFIDWECAGLGLPERDLASLAASLLTEAMRRATAESTAEGADKALERLDTETEKAWSAISALLCSYRAAPAAPALRASVLPHMTAYSLLCRALSYTSLTYEFDRLPKMVVKVASRMALHPDKFAGRFS